MTTKFVDNAGVVATTDWSLQQRFSEGKELQSKMNVGFLLYLCILVLLFGLIHAEVCPSGQTEHGLRCCKVITCGPGTEPVICNKDNPESTSCQLCANGYFQDQIITSDSHQRCKAKRVCPRNEGKVAVPASINNKTVDTICRCRPGYHDDSVGTTDDLSYSVKTCQLNLHQPAKEVEPVFSEAGKNSRQDNQVITWIVCVFGLLVVAVVVVVGIILFLYKCGKLPCHNHDEQGSIESGSSNSTFTEVTCEPFDTYQENNHPVIDVKAIPPPINTDQQDDAPLLQDDALLLQDESLNPGVPPCEMNSFSRATVASSAELSQLQDETEVKGVHPASDTSDCSSDLPPWSLISDPEPSQSDTSGSKGNTSALDNSHNTQQSHPSGNGTQQPGGGVTHIIQNHSGNGPAIIINNSKVTMHNNFNNSHVELY